MKQFRETVCWLIQQEQNITSEQQISTGTYFLENGAVLEYPREQGESRFPYSAEGLVLWDESMRLLKCWISKEKLCGQKVVVNGRSSSKKVYRKKREHFQISGYFPN